MKFCPFFSFSTLMDWWNLLWLAEAVLTCLWRRQYKLEMNRSWQTGRWKLWGWTCLHILTESDASLTKQRETSSDTLYAQSVAAAHTLCTWWFILRLCCLVWPICAVIGFLLFLALFFLLLILEWLERKAWNNYCSSNRTSAPWCFFLLKIGNGKMSLERTLSLSPPPCSCVLPPW